MHDFTFIGDNIKKWRAYKGIKQEHFADTIGVSRITLSKLENGRADLSLRLLFVIAKELGISYNDLLANVN